MTSPTMHDYSNYKNQRNRIWHEIQKYFPEEIILLCISHLNSPDATTPEKMRFYQPWFLLLLLKWTLLRGDFSQNPYRFYPSQENFNHLSNLLNELGGLVRMPTEYSDPLIWIKNMAHQQFWLQEQFTLNRIARQSLIFGNLDKSHSFHKEFHSLAGITIHDFIALTVPLIARFYARGEISVEVEWFRPIMPSYPEDKIKTFLDGLSRDLQSVRKYLREEAKGIRYNDPYYEFFEQSPLSRYPLLWYKNRYYCYSPNLLFHGLQTFIYDTLRSKSPNSFMDKFGSIFEKYVEKCIGYTSLPYITENTLKKEFGIESKVVDFVIIDSKSNILIDAKGVEMTYLGRVSHLSNVVLDDTRDSILKGIKQGYETAKELSKIRQIAGVNIEGNENFLLIITFKDFYVGNGMDFYNAIAKSEIDTIIAENGGIEWIPSRNIYFLSIDDLDTYVECVKQRGQGFVDVLRQAIVNDSSAQAKTLLLRQHVYSVCAEDKIGSTDYLNSEFQRLMEQLKIQLPS